MLLRRFNNILLLLLFGLLSVADADAQLLKKWSKFKGTIETYHRVKVGFGIPHGILGVNGEIGYSYVSLNAGLGYAMLKDVSGNLGYYIGLRGYAMPEENKLRIRGSFGYGVNNVFKEEGKQHVARGISFGIGYEHKFKKNIVYDMELTFPVNSTNSARPTRSDIEFWGFPSVGLGIML